MKYSDLFMDWLVELGFTHCFYLSGGNVMHLLESASHRFECIPVVHEVSAGIAADYFNEVHAGAAYKAFVLVTAGPGITNLVTAVAGAYLESRELLIVGGQVKSTDLKKTGQRQRGIQEIDGVSLVKHITKEAIRIEKPIRKWEAQTVVQESWKDRKGPVFIEFCLDAQAAPIEKRAIAEPSKCEEANPIIKLEKNAFGAELEKIKSLLSESKRPVVVLGGGLSRTRAWAAYSELGKLGIPIMTSWNGADRFPSDSDLYFGRPNTWGMRYSNLLIQQSDLIFFFGVRLGLQFTGFNVNSFAPLAKIVQIDIDDQELREKNPHRELTVNCDADEFLERFLIETSKVENNQWDEWVRHCRSVKSALPLSEAANEPSSSFVNTYDFYTWLSLEARSGDVLVPSSSGAAETVAMQAFQNLQGVQLVTSKGLASMGYGLAGAIGAAMKTGGRILHVEGDGGLAQNIQEFGTVSAHNLNIKTFIFSNDGYASIRMTQKNYFNNHYVGCDSSTGLNLPVWSKLAEMYEIDYIAISDLMENDLLKKMLQNTGPAIIEVLVDPAQTYFPKITSFVDASGNMQSHPLHRMTPELPSDVYKKLTLGLLD
jgi:acetolactate synthase-1/2/3 large subunit